ncbi:hypothetical protein [Deinococcus puniceus]|uniref:Uncharacterized protein n=1 Tax=Deinococcus puniceus TaxID=1182568 RepID=A0A172TC07_9DEIO|nr:hypothetical protein [Deinococcus puniceus]ANE44333.1 hypothetical protein SU48_11800 [Deinococcus puniceus]
MEIRQLRAHEVQNYLAAYYSYHNVQNPEDFAATKLEDYTPEDLQQVADLFTVALCQGQFIAGICLYQGKFLQDGWPDTHLEGFAKIIDTLINTTGELATYLNGFKPSESQKIQELLESKGLKSQTIYDMKRDLFGSLYTEDATFQVWSEELDQTFQDIYRQCSGEFAFSYDIAKNHMGGGFSPQFWLLDNEGGMIGANHPAHHADNEIIFTVAALCGPENSKRKLLHTLMAKIYAVYPAAEVHTHAEEKDKGLLESVGFAVRDTQKLLCLVKQ